MIFPDSLCIVFFSFLVVAFVLLCFCSAWLLILYLSAACSPSVPEIHLPIPFVKFRTFYLIPVSCKKTKQKKLVLLLYLLLCFKSVQTTTFYKYLLFFSFFFFFFAKHIIVGLLFRNIHPSLQYFSRSCIHTSLWDFCSSRVHPAL